MKNLDVCLLDLFLFYLFSWLLNSQRSRVVWSWSAQCVCGSSCLFYHRLPLEIAFKLLHTSFASQFFAAAEILSASFCLSGKFRFHVLQSGLHFFWPVCIWLHSGRLSRPWGPVILVIQLPNKHKLGIWFETKTEDIWSGYKGKVLGFFHGKGSEAM